MAEIIIATDRPSSPRDELIKGLWRENPVFVQVLGMCPTLAVTNTAENALAMGLATLFVLSFSAAIISAGRTLIPNQVRIATFVLVIATFVTVVDYLIQAIDLDLHAALGAFIALIVVNCLILGRMEAFAARHTPTVAVLDAIGMGLGFTWALLCLGVVREVLGFGTLFGLSLFPASFQPWTVMVLPSGGFFVLALWLLIFSRIARSGART